MALNKPRNPPKTYTNYKQRGMLCYLMISSNTFIKYDHERREKICNHTGAYGKQMEFLFIIH